MVRRILIAALLLAGGGGSYVAVNNSSQPVHGSYRSAYYQTVVSGGGSYRGVASSVDTIKVLVQDSDFPNTAAADSGWIYADSYYDVINEASTTGDYDVRYGVVDRAASTTVYPAGRAAGDADIWATSSRGEDDVAAWPTSPATRVSFVSFNLADSGIEQGDRIESAFILINRAYSWTLTGAASVWARLDTVAADYRIYDEWGADTDEARFNCSWTEILDTANETWSPTLFSAGVDTSAGRDDMNDYGPRSDNGITVDNQGTATGAAMRIEVTSALQRYVDLGMPCGENVLFVLYGVASGGANPSASFAAGNAAVVNSALNGKPALTVVATSRRGSMMWGDGSIPVTLSFDDGQQEQANWCNVLGIIGAKPALALHKNAMVSYAWIDSLRVAHPAYFKVAHHGHFEDVTGDKTGTELDNFLARSWLPQYFTDPPDTNLITDYIYGGGTGVQRYSWEAISRMIDLGYRSARADADLTVNTAIGYVSTLSWSLPVNVFAFKSFTATSVFKDGGSPTSSYDYIADNIKDLVDLHVRTYGNAAVMLHAHSIDQNGISAAGLVQFITALGNLNCAKWMDYEDVLTMRIGAFMDPAEITQANGYSAELETSAARSDSLRYETNDNRLKVWLAPR